MRGGTYLVDELETFLVGHALVGELNRVEREGGGRVEGDHAGHEEGRSLRERGSPARDATARAPLANSGGFQWTRLLGFDCDPSIAFSTLGNGQSPA